MNRHHADRGLDTDIALDRAITTLAPVSDADVAALITVDARLALTALAGADRSPSALPAPARAPRPLTRRYRVVVGLGAVAAGLAALVLPVGGGSQRAWAAPLVQFAQRSPLLVLDKAGWSVTRADEKGDLGEMTFANGTNTADLVWQPASSAVDLNDRFSTGVNRGAAPTPSGLASVIEIPVDAPASAAVTASTLPRSGVAGSTRRVLPIRFAGTWTVESASVQFTADVSTLVEFTDLLAALKQVDVDDWLSAMPASVIAAAGQPAVIAALLDGVPIPDGMDVAGLADAALVTDRYQLVTRVAGAVACAWLDRWFEATEAGDRRAAKFAADALATSRHWPMLAEIRAAGFFSDEVWAWADAVNGGPGIATGVGLVAPTRDLAGASLGCRR